MLKIPVVTIQSRVVHPNEWDNSIIKLVNAMLQTGLRKAKLKGRDGKIEIVKLTVPKGG